MSGHSDISRRALIKAGAVAAAGTVAGPELAACTLPADGPRVLTRAQYAVLDELTEIVIPTDAHSGGSRAAGVAAYIDAMLAEEFDAAIKASFIAGLDGVEKVAREQHGRGFVALEPPAREAIVTAMASGEADPRTEEHRFFVELKRRTVKGYYTSRIGIHDDLQYKGNTMQEEYSGVDVSR